MWHLLSLASTLLINCNCVDSATESAIRREEFENLKTTVNHLKKLAEKQSSRNKRLESVIEKQDRKIHDLQAIVSRCAELGQRQEKDISPQSEQMRQLASFVWRHKNTEDNVKIPAIERRQFMSALKVKRYEPNTVAFFAIVSVVSLDHLGGHQNIVFDEIVTNIGNGYNNQHGVFIAPVSGLYLFTTSIQSRQNMEFWAGIVVKGRVIVRLNERGTDGRHGRGSQTIIISLNKGELYFNLNINDFKLDQSVKLTKLHTRDDVAIQNEHNDDSFFGLKYSSFGGYLIQELVSETSSIVG
ncbi:uncharacterized protein LOC132723801 [Ruditapes philippinarum]|uniref:uncharacterized protein LOC132723801 n=1 Tax=Ruditapes philippinarum TaxID=129788 RepID=UPI00295B03AA|nr:uncharacterized protein LOC132723801 [Ruditapes philippinarum]